MENPSLEFPVKIFDLNSETEIKSLFELHKQRKTSVKDQSEWGIHGVFSVRSAEDIPKIMATFERLASRVSIFEIKFINDIQTTAFVPIFALKQQVIVSGASDTYIDVTGISFAIFAQNIHIHHLKWGNMGIKSALSIGATDHLILEHLTFTDNQYDLYYKDIVEPRIVIASNAKDDTLTRVELNNITFKNNKTKSLLSIADDSLEKIGVMSFDHLVMSHNQTISMGIDISAVQTVTLYHSIIRDHADSPALVQRTPHAKISFNGSDISRNDYRYIPIPQYKDIKADPVFHH